MGAGLERACREARNRNIEEYKRGIVMKTEWTSPKRYDFKVGYDGWRDTYVKPIEEEFGQYVSYSSYENLLKAIDSLEERRLG